MRRIPKELVEVVTIDTFKEFKGFRNSSHQKSGVLFGVRHCGGSVEIVRFGSWRGWLQGNGELIPK